jgi:hypothetical protein
MLGYLDPDPDLNGSAFILKTGSGSAFAEKSGSGSAYGQWGSDTLVIVIKH